MQHALELGRQDVDQVLAELSSSEWVEWIAFYRLRARRQKGEAPPKRAKRPAPMEPSEQIRGITAQGSPEELAAIRRMMKA